MDFTKLNLKQYITEGITSSNNLATNAEAKTSEMASGIGKTKQMDPGRKNAQIKQRAARVGPTTMNNTVDVTPQATSTAESFINQRNKIELEKQIRAHTSDWRKDLAEAVNPDDDPQHPYVEIMPHHKYKEKEAKKNALKAAAKDRMNGEPPLRTGVNEESIKAKKVEGKAIPVGKGARNADNTATPRENVGRRYVNKNPQVKGEMQDHVKKRVVAEQSMADAKKRRQNLTIEVGMRRRQADPKMPKPNLEYAKESLEGDFAKEKQRRHDIGMELAQREKKDKDKIAKRRERVNYSDYKGVNKYEEAYDRSQHDYSGGGYKNMADFNKNRQKSRKEKTDYEKQYGKKQPGNYRDEKSDK